MAWLDRILYGVDLDMEQQRQNDTDAALAALNEKKRAQYGDQWFEDASAQLEAGRMNVRYEVNQAFDEGLQEGADNVTAVVSKPFEIAGTAAGSVLKAFPWWLWIGGLIAAAWFLWPVLGPALGARVRR